MTTVTKNTKSKIQNQEKKSKILKIASLKNPNSKSFQDPKKQKYKKPTSKIETPRSKMSRNLKGLQWSGNGQATIILTPSERRPWVAHFRPESEAKGISSNDWINKTPFRKMRMKNKETKCIVSRVIIR